LTAGLDGCRQSAEQLMADDPSVRFEEVAKVGARKDSGPGKAVALVAAILSPTYILEIEPGLVFVMGRRLPQHRQVAGQIVGETHHMDDR